MVSSDVASCVKDSAVGADCLLTDLVHGVDRIEVMGVHVASRFRLFLTKAFLAAFRRALCEMQG